MRRPPGVRQRIASVSITRQQGGATSGPNPAGLQGNLKELLPQIGKARSQKAGKRHCPLYRWIRIGYVSMGDLEDQKAVSALKPLNFAILTGRTFQAKFTRQQPWSEMTWKVELWRLKR